MPSPVPVQYFSGRSSLSLARLDANLRHIADLERSYTALGGGLANVPFYCREGLAFFFPEKQASPSGEMDSSSSTAKPPEDFTPPTPTGNYLWAPGVVDSIAITDAVKQPALLQGCICIPLATEDEQEATDSSSGTPTTYPGAVRSVSWYGGLTRPRVFEGDVQLPLAHSGTVSIDASTGQPVTAPDMAIGGVYAAAVNAAPRWEVQHGCVLIPPAQSATTNAGEGDSLVISTPAVPGVLAAVAVVPEQETPAIDAGCLKLPLAHYDSAAGVFDRPGLIKAVEIDAAVGSPTIVEGVLHLPQQASTSPPADTDAGIVGIIASIHPGQTADWKIEDGKIYVPPAQYDPDAGAAAVPGVIHGVCWEQEAGRTEPSIWQGVLHIPVPDVSEQMLTHCKVEDTTEDAGWVADNTLHLYLAQDSLAGTPRAGLISGITYTTDASPGIENGVIRLPAADGYSFDPAWFVVSDGQVTLNSAALATVAEELAAEMAVEVTGTGVLEQTFAGTLRANTAGTLTLNSTVTY